MSTGQILSGDVIRLLDMTEIQLLRPEGLVASPAFSHVAVVPPGATTVYVGGQNAVDQNGELVGGTDVAAQTRQVMANLVTALQAAGAGIEHLVSVLVVLVEGVDVQAAYAAAGPRLAPRRPLRWSARRLCQDSVSPVPWWRCPQSRRRQIESLQTERSGALLGEGGDLVSQSPWLVERDERGGIRHLDQPSIKEDRCQSTAEGDLEEPVRRRPSNQDRLFELV